MGIIEGEENRDTPKEFLRIGLHVADRHCLEPVVQLRPQPGKGSFVDSKCVLQAGKMGGIVDSVKDSRKV